MFKNVASQKVIVFAFDSTTNLPKTGDAGNITAYVSKDYGTVTVLGDTSATEMDATNAKGYYLFDLTQAETNGDTLLFSAKSSTANIVVIGVPATVFTAPANFTSQSIDSNGRLDVIKVAGTTQTARDLGASVLLSTGTGTGQLDFTSGVVKANATQWLGGTIPAVNVTGVPKVDIVDWLGSAPNALNAGRVDAAASIRSGTCQTGSTASTIKLDASASATDNLYHDCLVWVTGGTGAGQVASIQSYVGSTKIATIFPNWTTTPDNTSTFTIVPASQVDVGNWLNSVPNALQSGRVDSYLGATGAVTLAANTTQLAGQTVTAAAGVTFPSSVASPTNITAGTIANLTNLPSIPANWLTAAGIAAAALNGKGDWLLASSYTAPPTSAAIATTLWQDLLAGTDFGTAGSIGALLKADVDAAISSRSTYAGGDTSGTTTLLARLTSGRATNLDNLDAAVSTRSTYAGADTSGTTTLLTRIPGTVQPQTGDSYARLGAPVGASLSADIASVKSDTNSIVNTVATLAAVNNAATSAVTTTGTVIGGTFASTATKDGAYLIWAPAAGGLNAYLQFTLSANQNPTQVAIYGRFVAAGSKLVDVYAYNWNTSAWDKLSNASTAMIHRTTDTTYTYALNVAHQDQVANLVRIRFGSTEVNTTYRLNLDRVLVNSIADTANLGGSVDVGTIGGAAVQLDSNNLLSVNAADIGGATSVGSAGYAGVDWGQVANPASAVVLSGTTVGTLTTYTGDTPQTGDAFARIGVAGAGLTALGDARIANLDAAISSRTKPADTQAAVTLVATTTNLTTLPAVPADWLTAAGVKADAVTKIQAGLATPTNITAGTITNVGGDVVGKVLGGGASAFTAVGVQADLQTIKTQTITCAAGVTILASVGTATTDTAQSGDSYGRLGASGVGLTALAPSSTALSTAQWTNALAANLGTLASHDPGATLSALTAAGVRSAVGLAAANLDAQIAAVQADTDDMQARLPAALVGGKMDSTAVVTGDFSATMKSSLNAATPASVAGNVGGIAGTTQTFDALQTALNTAHGVGSWATATSVVVTGGTVDNLANLPSAPTDWLTAAAVSAAAVAKIQNGLSTYAGADTAGTSTLLTRIPGTVQPQTGDAFVPASSAASSAATAATAASSAAADTATILGRLGAFAGSGLNTVFGFFRALLRKDAGLTPSGVGGTFDNTTDSTEAIADAAPAVTVAGYAAGQDPATLVLDALAASHNTAGSIGHAINAAGDPLISVVPGNYAAGTAGAVLGSLIPGQIIVTGPTVSLDGNTIYVRSGFDFYAVDSRSFDFTDTGALWQDLGGATVSLVLPAVPYGPNEARVSGTILTPSGMNKKVRFEMSSAFTGSLSALTRPFEVQATLADGNRVLLVDGYAEIRA